MPEGSRQVFTWGWQSKFHTLAERIAFLLERNILSDVEFVVGNGADALAIPAHKFILATASKRFERLFYSPSPDFSESKPIVITQYVTPAAFRNVLRYIYTDNVSDMQPKDVMDTLFAARYYDLPSLISVCERNIPPLCDRDNALLLLDKAVQYGEGTIAEHCLVLIDQHLSSMITCDQWLNISLETLKRILSRDGLHIKEIDVYNAAERWARYTCEKKRLVPSAINKRQELQDALFLVRFPLLAAEELITCSAKTKTGLLNVDELNDLLLQSFNPLSVCPLFSSAKRAYGKAGEEIIIKRFSAVVPLKNKARNGVEDLIAFRVNKQVMLQAVGLFGNASRFAKYNVVMKLIRVVADEQEIIASRETLFTADNTNCIFRVEFENLIRLDVDKFYIISVVLDGDQTWYGCGGKVTETSGKGATPLSVDFFEAEVAPSSAHRTRHAHYGTHHLAYRRRRTSGNVTNVNEGQIPELIFRSIHTPIPSSVL